LGSLNDAPAAFAAGAVVQRLVSRAQRGTGFVPAWRFARRARSTASARSSVGRGRRFAALHGEHDRPRRSHPPTGIADIPPLQWQRRKVRIPKSLEVTERRARGFRRGRCRLATGVSSAAGHRFRACVALCPPRSALRRTCSTSTEAETTSARQTESKRSSDAVCGTGGFSRRLRRFQFRRLGLRTLPPRAPEVSKLRHEGQIPDQSVASRAQNACPVLKQGLISAREGRCRDPAPCWVA
jgi:hypothetical protein